VVGDRRKLPVLVSDLLPDYPLPMLAGDTVSLHNLLGERLTLLDLWASWCGPCRVQNRDFLVPLWDQYHQRGFQIIGYGLEASSKAWARAIEADGAYRWPHASDLQGDDSPLFELLRLTTIPANFLLDAEGRVVAKNLHGEELMEYVRRVME
jgi:thiol-disulfide isomerase/thioredoxin